MLGIYIFITALLVPSFAQNVCDIDCPRDGTGRCIDRNYPNPVDCGSFCQCANCIPYRQACPPGTHYDPNEDRCRDRNNIDCRETTLAPAPTTPVPPGASRVAAFVGNRFSRTGVENPVPFDTVYVNLRNHYRTNTHSITVPEDGIYFNSISAAAPASTGLQYDLRANNITQVDLLRTSTTHSGPDTTSRDYLSSYLQGEVLNVGSFGPGTYSEANGTQTSWTSYQLSNAMNRTVAWMVAKTENHMQEQQRVSFDSILLNEGALWDPIDHQLNIPRTGVYYLFWTAGSLNGTLVNFDLRRSSPDELDLFMDLLRTNRNSNGQDVCSRGVLVQLDQGNNLYLWSWEQMFSNNNYQVSFGGFEYNPRLGTPLSWSGARTSSWADANSDLDPVTFDVVLANQGGAWDAANNRAICVRSGHYFVSINAAALVSTRLRVNLMQDEERIAVLSKDDETHDGNYATSRALLVTCQAGQRLRLVAVRGTGIYSDVELQTSFSGFWLYPL